MRVALGNTTEAYSIFKKAESESHKAKQEPVKPEPVKQKIEEDKTGSKPGRQ